MSNYFQFFPSVEYPGFGIVRDITARVAIDVSSSASLKPFTQQAGVRPEVVSDLYYDTMNLDWLVMMANDVINPFEDVFLTEEQLMAMVIKKYGSTQEAAKPKHWLNNWRADDSVINKTIFDNLHPTVKQLFNPVVDYQGNTIGFRRKQEDIIRPTSLSLFVSSTLTGEAGDTIEFINLGNAVGTGIIKAIQNGTIVIHHIEGVYNAPSVRVGSTTQSFTIQREVPCISIFEAPYYSPETFFEYEQRVNDNKQQGKLVDKLYADTAVKQLRQLLK
jgi:hypothetical protein